MVGISYWTFADGRFINTLMEYISFDCNCENDESEAKQVLVCLALIHTEGQALAMSGPLKQIRTTWCQPISETHKLKNTK